MPATLATCGNHFSQVVSVLDKLNIVRRVTDMRFLAVQVWPRHLCGTVPLPSRHDVLHGDSHFEIFPAVPFPIIAAFAGKTASTDAVQKPSATVLKIVRHAFSMTARIVGLLLCDVSHFRPRFHARRQFFALDEAGAPCADTLRPYGTGRYRISANLSLVQIPLGNCVFYTCEASVPCAIPFVLIRIRGLVEICHMT